MRTNAPEKTDALLEVSDLTKHFGGLAALSELSLAVPRGKIMGLIGPNGSGKTTFFNVITGIYPATSGSCVFNGHNILGLSPQDIYHLGISRTFQRSRLVLSLSIFDNIALGRASRLGGGLFKAVFARAAQKREMLACLDEAVALLAVFDPELARDPFRPVGGLPMISRRHVEICRALVSGPKLLLLDEPSAGMTHEETRRLVDDILRVKEKTADLTVIIIEHEMSVMERITDHCAVLNFGAKICEGTYQAVSMDPEVQEAYLGSD